MHLDSATKSSPMTLPVIALVGPPNAGKTTLYNWITGAKYRAVNYPGSTVEFAIGESAPRMKHRFHLIDTPGTYSLSPKGEDEEITVKALFHQHKVGSISHIVVVVDGTQLNRHLMLVKQIQEIHLPVTVVVTMNDLLIKAGQKLNLELLSDQLACPVILFDGVLGEGLSELDQALANAKTPEQFAVRPQSWSPEKLDQAMHWAARLNRDAVKSVKDEARQSARQTSVANRTRLLDKFLLHSFLGPLFFFGIMSLLFTSIYWLAAPLMDLIDGSFAASADFLKSTLPGYVVTDFFADGLIVGFGAVLVFVPQIFILFFGVGLLETSGYLARAATLIDRPLALLGMSGRSFVPLLSGFACAVPAMMAARNLSSRRDRMITNFIIPLMTCSARLPVYGLLLGLIFIDAPAWQAGLALAALYIGALVIGGLAAAVLNRLIAADRKSVLVMELPLYRRPRLTNILVQSFKRTRDYVWRAGPTILVLSIGIWGASYFPRALEGAAVSQLEQSYLGQAGQYLSPITEPMGADWRMGVGLLSAFAAREVFVSALAIIFSVENGEENVEGMLSTLKAATWPDGRPLMTVASVCSLLIFFMIALQCLSTFAIAKKESGSWNFAVGQLVALNLVAYVLAVVTYQTLHLFGL